MREPAHTHQRTVNAGETAGERHTQPPLTLRQGSMEIAQTSTETCHVTSHPTPKGFSKRNETHCGLSIPMRIAALAAQFTVAKICKQPGCPKTDAWHVHAMNHYLDKHAVLSLLKKMAATGNHLLNPINQSPKHHVFPQLRVKNVFASEI